MSIVNPIKKQVFIWAALFLAFTNTISAQNFYDINTIQEIELQFSYPNWDYMMDTAKAGSGSYILADWVRINGTQFDSVGVKYKGNSSYNQNKVKNPLHIELDHFVNTHIYDGITDIKLSNGFKDPSLTRETVAYTIARTYMSAPRANYARLFINGVYIGLYTNVESITKKFVNNHFYSKTNAFFKCNPVYSTNSKSNLVYHGSDSTLYFNSYELKSNSGWFELVALCEILKFTPEDINNVLDIDRVLWMHAFNNLLVNLDSYLGAISQNYYLYKSDNGSFNAVVWDLNEAFGCFNNSGIGPPLNIVQMQEMPPWLHLNNFERPLVQRLLNHPLYKRMYMAHYRTMYNEFIHNNAYLSLATSFQQIIDSSVQADTFKLFSYADFSNNLTQNIASGMGLIPGLSYLMNGRSTYLSTHPDMLQQQPTITNIHCADTTISLSDTATFLAHVQDALNVYVGYRYNQTERFSRIKMFDDGLHNDGLAGDNVYGAQIPVLSTQIEYYIYAENANAGRFSPQRAEYEFYVQNFTSQLLMPGMVVINEFMALNNQTITNANGMHDDWIELYNNTADTINLTGLYLSDNYNQPLKWAFPQGTSITPNGYVLIWASNSSHIDELHASFKLSGNGESIILAYDNGYVVDSLTFGTQISDISFGRYPNGTGTFTFMPPTPLAPNILTGISEQPKHSHYNIFPNPSNGYFTIQHERYHINSVIINDIHGRQLAGFYNINELQVELDISFLASGLYLIYINNIHVLKLLKQ
jgi:hypothetical protein